MSAARSSCLAVLAATALSILPMVAACGADRPPPGGSPPLAPPSPNDGVSTDAPKLPGCGQQESGAFCDCVDAPLFVDPPTMYFALDRSGSMAENGKWSSVGVTVAAVLRQVGERASFGALVFPGDGSPDACDPGREILSVRPGDPPSGKDGPTTTGVLVALRAISPGGGTPTAAALKLVQGKLAGRAGKAFVLLATDGGPNCNAAAKCEASMCMDNIESAPGCPPGGPPNCCAPPVGQPFTCLDEQPTLDAAAALNAAGFPVYVIGIPGSAPYADLLDRLATAGGTAQPQAPRYFRVDQAGQGELLATLKRIAARIVATCEFKLKQPPADENYVNVYFDEQVLPKDPVNGNGWSIQGDTLTLNGGACAAVKSGAVLDVRIIVGCPSVIH